MEEIDDEILQDLYTWVDHVPLSRPKRNMARDFSDGVMCAEVLAHHFPKMVELHNYVPASSTKQKEENWKLLNRKVLRKLNMELSEDVIKSLALAKAYTIERVLLILRSKIDRTIFEKQRCQETRLQYSDRPEVDQHAKHHKVSPGRKAPQQKGLRGTLSTENVSSQAHMTTKPKRHPLLRSPSPSPSWREIASPAPSQKSNLKPPQDQKSALKSPKNAGPQDQKSKTSPKNPAPKEPQSSKPDSGRPPLSSSKAGPMKGSPAKGKPEGPGSLPKGAQTGEISIKVPQLPSRTGISAREAKEFTSDYMSRLAYEEKAQECLAKDETIEILNAKVRRLEHLVHLKDIRIEDLQARLEELRPTNKRH